jgi:hypothetical protein
LLGKVRGDIYRCGILHGALINGEFNCNKAPHGAVQFSPDSRTLFESSTHIYQWDVSRLK